MCPYNYFISSAPFLKKGIHRSTFQHKPQQSAPDLFHWLSSVAFCGFYQFSCYVIGLFEQTKAGPEGPINYDDCQWMIAIAYAITPGLSITNWR